MKKQRITVYAESRETFIKLATPETEPMEDGSVGQKAIYGILTEKVGEDINAKEVVHSQNIRQLWGETKQSMIKKLEVSMAQLIKNHDKAKKVAISELQSQIDQFNAIEP